MARRYRPVWEAEPQFAGWLTNVEGQASKAFCKLCKCSLQAHKKDLSNHANCKKHQEAFKFSQLGNSSKKINTFFNKNITFERKVSELKIAAFIAKHCSILAADHLGVLISALDKSSSVLSDLKLHRTKCAGLIKNVISPCILEELIKDIGDSNFSAIIDESTCVDTKKTLCIMIRYFSKTTFKVKTVFYTH
ncbi:unnamed protein product [Parnassius apollo]|uniref:(apollo) hypothetical protein n=1 Tax=Parnassius apollo TaxID=110799 RepID=A0A8S3Y3R3_PARAO|nr:unnamed protein product [Parnassius apollo]